MHIQVLFFGRLKDIFGRNGDTLELPECSTVQQMLEHSALQAPKFQAWIPSMAIAVNQHYSSKNHILNDGDEVALLPPVSGGTANQLDANAYPHVCIQDDPILPEQILAQLKCGEDGAVVVFDGIVRNHTRGRRTLYLEYEAYREMALAQMQELALKATQQFSIRDLCIIHRLGRLQIGETSVWIAVASAHRAAAFDACRWIIDTLKKTVPIWKKEYFEDGATWADGEPFPAEMIAPSNLPKLKNQRS